MKVRVCGSFSPVASSAQVGCESLCLAQRSLGLFIILGWLSVSADMAESNFTAKGLFLKFMWTAVDKQSLRKGQIAAKQLIRDGGGRSIDLEGLSFEPDGIVFPFKTATAFRSAYGCMSRVFKPLLDEAGLHKDQWGFKVIGDAVVTDPVATKEEGTDPKATKVEVTDPRATKEVTDQQEEGTDPEKPPTKQGTDPSIWPPSVPLKLTRGIRCDKGCGMRVKSLYLQ